MNHLFIIFFKLLDSVLKELSDSERNEFLLVKLNGLVHTDDNLALRAIIEQLHVRELDGDLITGSFSGKFLYYSHITSLDVKLHLLKRLNNI